MAYSHEKDVHVCCREVNRGGLPMLYEMLLEISGPEVKCALEVSLQSSPIANVGSLLSTSGMYKHSELFCDALRVRLCVDELK